MRVYCTKSHILLENDTGGKLCYSKLDGRCEDYLASEVIPDAILCGSAGLFLGSLNCDDLVYLLFATSVSVVGHFSSEKDLLAINRINRVKAISVCSEGRVIKEILDDSNCSSRLKQSSEKLMRFVQDKLGSSNGLIDETLQLFNDHPDFYYCFERDITRSTEKYFSGLASPDDRFFWNKHLLSSILDSKLNDDTKSSWCIPVIQGFVTSVELSLHEDPIVPAVLNLTLISRRSVHRAGARYLRRGVDSKGPGANFVETELVLNIFNHQLSFVQVRDASFIFWLLVFIGSCYGSETYMTFFQRLIWVDVKSILPRNRDHAEEELNLKRRTEQKVCVALLQMFLKLFTSVVSRSEPPVYYVTLICLTGIISIPFATYDFSTFTSGREKQFRCVLRRGQQSLAVIKYVHIMMSPRANGYLLLLGGLPIVILNLSTVSVASSVISFQRTIIFSVSAFYCKDLNIFDIFRRTGILIFCIVALEWCLAWVTRKLMEMVKFREVNKSIYAEIRVKQRVERVVFVPTDCILSFGYNSSFSLFYLGYMFLLFGLPVEE